MSASLMPQPKIQFFDNTGLPLSGGLIYTYIAGTSTPKATYTSIAGNIANANPVVLDAYGQASIWLNGYYKVDVRTAANVSLYTQDNVSSANGLAASGFSVAWTDVDAYGGLATTVGVLGASTATIVVQTAQTLTSSLTIPTNITLVIWSPGSINIASAQTLTINGTLNLFENKTLAFTGAGTVVYGAQSVLVDSTVTNAIAANQAAFLASSNTWTGATNDFTGSTPLVPTQALGDSSTKAASTAFAAGLAFQAALPAQTGNSGKFVTTNGSAASWGAVFPSETGNSGKFLTNSGTFNSESWAFPGIGVVNSTVTTSTSITGNYKLIPVTMSSLGQSITLPAANTLPLGGPQYVVDNTKGGYPCGIRDSTGTLLGALAAGGESYVSLKDNSTAAGLWSIAGSNLEPGLITVDSTFSSTYSSSQVYAPFAALDSNTSIHFAKISSGFVAFVVDNLGKVLTTPVTVTTTASSIPAQSFSVTPTTAVVFYGSSTTDHNVVVLTLSGSSPSLSLSVGTPSSVTATTSAGAWNGESSVNAPQIAQLSSTEYLAAFPTTAALFMSAIQVSGSTVTAGALGGPSVANLIPGSTIVYALTSTTAIVLYKSSTGPYTNNCVILTVSGTTSAAGTPVSLTGNVSSSASPSAATLLSPTKCLVQDDNNVVGSVIVSALTVSGTSVVAGTALFIETTSGASSFYTTNSGCRYNPHLFTTGSNSALLWYMDSPSGSSRAVVITESGGVVTAGAILYRSISSAATGAAGYGYILPQGSSEFVSVVQQLSTASGCGLKIAPCRINGTSITSGAAVPLLGCAPTQALYINATRLTSGNYVGASTSPQGSPCGEIAVFSSNGDRINFKGYIAAPIGPLNALSQGPLQAVSSNRVVMLGQNWEGMTLGPATASLRLLNIEVIA